MVKLYYSEHHNVTISNEVSITEDLYKEFCEVIKQANEDGSQINSDFKSLPKKYSEVTNEQWLNIIKDISNIDKSILGNTKEDWVSDRKGFTDYTWSVRNDKDQELIRDTTVNL
jgi:hypothetical protein